MGKEKKYTGQRDKDKEQGERSRCGYRLLAIKLLDAPAVIIRQHEVLRIHPLVKGCHDGRGIIGVLKAQGMAQLMHGHQKDVIAWRDGEGYDGSLGPFPKTSSFAIRGFSFTPNSACQVLHSKSHKAPQLFWEKVRECSGDGSQSQETNAKGSRGPVWVCFSQDDICLEKWVMWML